MGHTPGTVTCVAGPPVARAEAAVAAPGRPPSRSERTRSESCRWHCPVTVVAAASPMQQAQAAGWPLSNLKN
jgi:hypothetical protein